jgi:hypothetical protein
VSDYKTISKTDWFIQKMSSDWFSYQGILDAAVAEFPDVPKTTLEGTIGQYWSDCVNEKWSTYKAIRNRGLRVLERTGHRRIVDKSIYRVDD